MNSPWSIVYHLAMSIMNLISSDKENHSLWIGLPSGVLYKQYNLLTWPVRRVDNQPSIPREVGIMFNIP